MNNIERLVGRSDKVNFMKIGEGEYVRMKGFTSMGEDKNPEEYSRKYVDNSFESVDVTGVSPSVDFEMDQITNDPVHEVIVGIFDNEKLGDDAEVTILSVDFTRKIDVEAGANYSAKERAFSLIPESEGGADEAYTYEGSFKVKGNTVHGVAVFDKDILPALQETCTFKEK